MINTIKVSGYRDAMKGNLKRCYGYLKGNDAVQAEGKKEQMCGNLQVRLGKTKEELNEIIRIFNKPF
jgi:uncharacterized protein YjbJ (UPF0337 family)